jgi:hypothetical protein
MKRLRILVTGTLLMAAMLVLTMSPALSITKTIDKASPVLSAVSSGGIPVPTMICDVVGKDAGIIGWRNGTCWVFHPAPTSL